MRKNYFREPSLATILNGKEPVSVDKAHLFAERVMDLRLGQYVVVQTPIIPLQYHTPRKFLKHGRFVQVKTPRSIDEAVDGHMLPWVMREKAFDSVGSIYHSGYSFRSFDGYRHDQRERRVRLVELCEALRVMCYALQMPNPIEIEHAYAQSERVSKDGAVVAVSVPSRSVNQPRYRFNMYSVVVDSNDPNCYAIANGFNTSIKFPAKDWSFRFNYYEDREDSNVVNIFSPEIAAYYAFIRHERVKRLNIAPLTMSPFGIPTNLTVNYYKRLLSRVVIHDQRLKSKDKLRKLNKAEQEVMLWALVNESKYQKTFFRNKSIDGPVESLDWILADS